MSYCITFILNYILICSLEKLFPITITRIWAVINSILIFCAADSKHKEVSIEKVYMQL